MKFYGKLLKAHLFPKVRLTGFLWKNGYNISGLSMLGRLSCPQLFHPHDWAPTQAFQILQARILEHVEVLSSCGSSES